MAQTLSELLCLHGTFIRREHAPEQTQEARLRVAAPSNPHLWNAQRTAFSKLLEHCFLLAKELDKLPEFSQKDPWKKSEGSSVWTLLGGFLARSAKQFILLSKLDKTVELIEQLLSENKKPIVALQSTFESFLNVLSGAPDSEETESSEAGVLIGTLDSEQIEFKNLLHQNILKILPNFTQIVQSYPYLQPLYAQYEQCLAELPTFIASPIDYLQQRLEQLNIKYGEISGRTTHLKQINSSSLWSIEPIEPLPREQIIKNFNDGNLDVLFITQAGATGISLHASSDFLDSRQRAFLELEITPNPALRSQFLGRARRKGQLSTPEHYILLSTEPYEYRLLSRAQQRAKKLSFLQNSTNFDAKQLPISQNYLTTWSNQLVVLWLSANPSFAERMALSVKLLSEQTQQLIGGPADRFFHRIILLAPQEQEESLNFLDSAPDAFRFPEEAPAQWTLIDKRKIWGPPENTLGELAAQNSVYQETWIAKGSGENPGSAHIEAYVQQHPSTDISALQEKIKQSAQKYLGRMNPYGNFTHQYQNLLQALPYLKPFNKIKFLHPQKLQYTQALIARVCPPENADIYPFASHWSIEIFVPAHAQVCRLSLKTLLDDAHSEFFEASSIPLFAFNKQAHFPQVKKTLSGHPVYARWYCLKTSDKPQSVAFESIQLTNGQQHRVLPYFQTNHRSQNIPLLNATLCLKALFEDSQIALFDHKNPDQSSIVIRKVFKGWSISFSYPALAKHMTFMLQKRLVKEPIRESQWIPYFCAAKDLPVVLHHLYAQQCTFYLPESKSKWHEMALIELFLKK